jgi:hypothetical protein
MDVLCVVIAVGLAMLCLPYLSIALAYLVGVRARLLAEAGLPTVSAAKADHPAVLLQIPCFNEERFVERAVRSVAALDWPADRLRVQILDDSTDDTTRLAEQAAESVRRSDIDVTVVHRQARQGYKAGALRDGLANATEPFVAILDVDYAPPSDWLDRAVGALLTDDQLAYVQFRIGFANRFDSWVTKAQAALMDGQNVVEQTGRARGDRPGRRLGRAYRGGGHGPELPDRGAGLVRPAPRDPLRRRSSADERHGLANPAAAMVDRRHAGRPGGSPAFVRNITAPLVACRNRLAAAPSDRSRLCASGSAGVDRRGWPGRSRCLRARGDRPRGPGLCRGIAAPLLVPASRHTNIAGTRSYRLRLPKPCRRDLSRHQAGLGEGDQCGCCPGRRWATFRTDAQIGWVTGRARLKSIAGRRSKLKPALPSVAFQRVSIRRYRSQPSVC